MRYQVVVGFDLGEAAVSIAVAGGPGRAVDLRRAPRAASPIGGVVMTAVAVRRRRDAAVVGAGGAGAGAAQPGHDPADPRGRRAADRDADVLRHRVLGLVQLAGRPAVVPHRQRPQLVRALRHPPGRRLRRLRHGLQHGARHRDRASTTGCCWRRARGSASSSGRRWPASCGPPSPPSWCCSSASCSAPSCSAGSLGLLALWVAALGMAVISTGWALGVVYRIPDTRAGPILQIGIFFTMFLSTGNVPVEDQIGWTQPHRRAEPAHPDPRAGPPGLPRRRRVGHHLARPRRHRRLVACSSGSSPSPASSTAPPEVVGQVSHHAARHRRVRTCRSPSPSTGPSTRATWSRDGSSCTTSATTWGSPAPTWAATRRAAARARCWSTASR